MRRRAAPLWVRRLFHQRGPDGHARYGSDLGWNGPDGNIKIDDVWRFEALAKAGDGVATYEAGNAYLRKVLANYRRGTYDAGPDPLLAAAIDAECERVGRELTRAASAIVAEMRALGYGPADIDPERGVHDGEP
jgi:hypothetical protein